LSFEQCVRPKPRSPSSTSSLHATTARSNSVSSAGDTSDETAGDGCRSPVSTPKVLWAATPSPDASGANDYSFAMPSAELSANATVFVPEAALEVTAPRVAEPSGLRQDHAEAQAVYMAESVLDLDEPQSTLVVPDASALTEIQQNCVSSLDISAIPSFPSKGSALHVEGRCRPCAWMWKPRGCQNALLCEYCHLCPEDELKTRKKVKVAAIRRGALAPCPAADASKKPGLHKNLKLFDLL